MSDKELNNLNTQSISNNEEEIDIDLKEYFNIIINRKKLIFFIAAMIAVLSAVVMILTPNSYKSQAVMTPQASSAGGLSAILGSAANSALGSLVGSEGSDELLLYNSILSSKDIANNVVDNLDLIRIFNERNLLDFYIVHPIMNSIQSFFPPDPADVAQAEARRHEKFVKAFMKNIVSIENDEKMNTLSITVYDRDPNLAKKIADEYLIELEKFLNNNNVTVAKKNRVFLEGQLSENDNKLRQAEVALKQFQERNNVIDPDKQAEFSIQAAANIQSQISIEEMNLNIMKSTGYKTSFSGGAGGTPTVPQSDTKPQKVSPEDIQNSIVKLQQLKKQLNNMTFGESFSPLVKGKGKGISLPISGTPGLIFEYMRLKRDLLAQEKIFEFLTEQYEAAKLSESNESVSFIILDKPKVAAVKDKPKRGLMIVVGTIAGIFIGSVIAIFIDKYRQYKPLPGFLTKNETDNRIQRYLKELLD